MPRLKRRLSESMKPNPIFTHIVSRIVVYALGGNALSSPDADDGTNAPLILAKVMSDVVDLLEAGWQVVITHGNGPQVGHLLSLDSDTSMDSWVAATQGMIGHDLSINLDSILQKRGRPERTAVVLTRVEVDPTDPGFQWPTKPVGPTLDSKEVMSRDWDIAETAVGARRVVASPLPMRILDIDVISTLVEMRAVVICGGGGGIPVVQKGEYMSGVPAVIDKDRVSALIAIKLQADALIISTAVDAICTNYGKKDQKSHSIISVEDAVKHMAEGQFPSGSMGPKVGSMIEAVIHVPGLKSILCSPGNAIKALRGETGTTISK